MSLVLLCSFHWLVASPSESRAYEPDCKSQLQDQRFNKPRLITLKLPLQRSLSPWIIQNITPLVCCLSLRRSFFSIETQTTDPAAETSEAISMYFCVSPYALTIAALAGLPHS